MADGTYEYAHTNEFAEIFQRYFDSDENDARTTDSVSIESVPRQAYRTFRGMQRAENPWGISDDSPCGRSIVA
ncbi:MAG: hypothetical protein EGR45_00085 [Ruminococcaceae bacterium]|nr:hypothetical protein [Oscillospiraceae bacterium]